MLNYYALWKGWEIKLTMMTSLQNIDDRGANDPAVHPLCRGPLIRTLESSSYSSFQCLYWCFWVFCYMSIMETQKKKLWNILTVNCKSTRTTSMTSYLRLYYQFWTYFTHCYGVSTAGWHWTSKYRLGKALIPDLKHEFGC